MAIVSNPQTAEVTAEVAADIEAFADAFAAYGDQSDLADRDALLAAAGRLARHLPGYDTESRTMPWDRDDDFFFEGLELDGWLDAGVEAVYVTYTMTNSRPTLAGLASKFIVLSNHVAALVSWHPRYDSETGEIRSA